MKKNITKKLQKLELNKETLLSLASGHLNQVQGGYSEYPCTESCDFHCQVEQVTYRWCA